MDNQIDLFFETSETMDEAYERIVTNGFIPQKFFEDPNIGFLETCRRCSGNRWITVTTGDGSFGTLEQEICDICEGLGETESPKPTSLKMIYNLCDVELSTIMEMLPDVCRFVDLPFGRILFTLSETKPDSLIAEYPEREDFLFANGYMRGEECFHNPVADMYDLGVAIHRITSKGLILSLSPSPK